MTAPRLEIDLGRIHHNARALVDWLAIRGISVTGVTKATLGCAEVANTLLGAGVEALADSRIENLEALRRAGIDAPMTLVRSPMPSQIERVVRSADTSFNTEIDVIRKLSSAALGADRNHGVVLMVELGDLREGIMPADLHGVVRETLRLPNIELKGIGANLACRSGVIPDGENMAELSALADSVDSAFGGARGAKLSIVSGGNSANLLWALGNADCGRIDNLRLGESILLGCEPLHRKPIAGLHTDAFTLVAEVIECKVKPLLPWGKTAQNAFGEVARGSGRGRGSVTQVILAIGRQDIDPDGLQAPAGLKVLGTSSDHLVMESAHGLLEVGSEVRFALDYAALLRAMTSPFVSKVMTGGATFRRPVQALPSASVQLH